MSKTTTSVAATSTAACSNLYDTPVRDAACAMPYGGNHTKIMLACCNDADVVSYYNDCGLYCLAVDQTVTDLSDCLYGKGAPWGDVFCKGNSSATATATGKVKIPASASASVISTDSASNSEESKEAEASATSSKGAAPGFTPQSSVSTLGLTIVALLFSATMFGALQV
ncbi:hypothetical protein G7Z17_g2754 [Cylindrodendrum hubeiense]|uniref:Uncharacterized protein n=1 Tax=Cylindrodendrum hubeiense TaxID=595255 RepID=A0A9P5HI58_9HYPO|nr:hypothetical protein G7Z17_g2754 [Cylindrodendrum hubeiense]